MQKQLLTIAIVGIIIIGAVTAGGYYLGKVIQKPKTTPSPSESPLITEPTATPTPTPATVSSTPVLLPTAPPRTSTSTKQQVKGVTVTQNSTPITAKTGPDTTVSKQTSIRFVGVPAQASANQPFVVSWYIDGPEGLMGTSTRLETSLNSSSSTGSSSSSVSGSQSSSFGAFQIPQKFQSEVTFGGNSGPVVLKVTAEVGGITYTARQTVQLTD
ncbi:MAG: hypothetical protein Q7S57_00815 [bacterium]|nr:hypothetical protein [bacterium]